MSRFRIAVQACALCCALFVAPSFPAGADELQDINILYKKGDAAKALERLDSYLAGKPKDAQGTKIAQARFLKGLILAEQGKTPEAIKIYVSLTEDYPELPEPYNNLAVLYATSNQFDKARAALEMAISTHPSYATAHENLGDIYAKMASQAYDKALQLDKGNATAQTKLALVKEMFSSSGKPNRPAVKSDAGKAALTVPATPATPAAPAKPEPLAVPVKPEPVKAEPAKVEAAKPEPAKPPVEAKPVAPHKEKAESKQDAEAAVVKSLNAWAKAWASKNVAGYLASYAKDFKVPGGESRSSWEKTRKERISRPKSIHVSIEAPRVTFQDSEHASVTFRQNYKSDALSTSTMKTVMVNRAGDKWLIQQEHVGR
ncbi:MAG: tetratricopeptide repeat protein [Sulfuricella sp.]|nr:tetratricopeptide repeat protein [Sulfuricella sp.]